MRSRASVTRPSRRSRRRARKADRSGRCGTSARGSTPATVNKRAIEALIKCGAFGSTGATRKGMLGCSKPAQGAGQKAQQDLEIGQGSIFDARRRRRRRQRPPRARSRPRTRRSRRRVRAPELLAVEKESIGLFISAHPLKQVREALRGRVDCPLAELASRRDKDWVRAGGIIAAARRRSARAGASR